MDFMTPRRFNIYIKPLSWNTRHKNKLELTLELKTLKMFEMLIYSGRSFMAKSAFLNSRINLQINENLILSNHIPEMSFSIWDTYIL